MMVAARASTNLVLRGAPEGRRASSSPRTRRGSSTSGSSTRARRLAPRSGRPIWVHAAYHRRDGVPAGDGSGMQSDSPPDLVARDGGGNRRRPRSGEGRPGTGSSGQPAEPKRSRSACAFPRRRPGTEAKRTPSGRAAWQVQHRQVAVQVAMAPRTTGSRRGSAIGLARRAMFRDPRLLGKYSYSRLLMRLFRSCLSLPSKMTSLR